MSAQRFAIYAAPDPATALWRFGSGVLGYDAESGEEVAPHLPPGFAAGEWAALTADPRRYGFHGTLKAPFRLAEGRSAADLDGAMAALAGSLAAPPAIRLVLTRLGRFFALCPEGRPPALHAIADACVRDLDRFRAPLTAEERERRRPERLTERQRAQLEAFGYPYVFEDFRLHMTLTGEVPPERSDAVEAGLRAMVAEAAIEPLRLDALVIFEQPAPAERFRIRSRWPLAGPR
jgi:putative phosphonate metabolism protein